MDNKDFEILYHKYHRNLMIYAVSLTNDLSIAENLVQNTFVKALLTYKETGSFKYWITKVLRNEYLNSIRDNKKISETPIDEFDIAHNNNPLDQLIQNENLKEIAHAISQLPIKYRIVISATVYMQLDDSEIANLINSNEANVRKIRSRAREKLKQILGKNSKEENYE